MRRRADLMGTAAAGVVLLGLVVSGGAHRIRELAAKYLQTGRMTFVVVGDAATQAQRLEALGVGPVVPANDLLEAPAADR